MDNLDQDQSTDTETVEVSELALLKQRADMLGVKYSNNISITTLKERIEAKMNGETEQVTQPTDNPLGEAVPVKETEQQIRSRLYKENMRLIRVRVQCMDPKKKDLRGEIFTVANEYIGTVRKFIPFGEDTDDGFHIPFVLYKMLKRRKFQNIRTIKDKRTGATRPDVRWVAEFAIEVLDPLTERELDDLRRAQLAAGSIGD